MVQTSDTSDAVLREVRLFVFRQAAHTAKVPQPHEIAAALGRPQSQVEETLRQLAAGTMRLLLAGSGVPDRRAFRIAEGESICSFHNFPSQNHLGLLPLHPRPGK